VLLERIHSNVVVSDWMHDTDSCLGLSGILRTQAGRCASRFGPQLAGPKPALSLCAASPTRIDVTSATGSAPPCCRRCARLGQSGPGGPDLTPPSSARPPRAAGGAALITTTRPSPVPSAWGSRGRCPGAYHSVRQLGRSAACTGSPEAGGCDGLGVTGPPGILTTWHKHVQTCPYHVCTVYVQCYSTAADRHGIYKY
jgi:hypothetical protein